MFLRFSFFQYRLLMIALLNLKTQKRGVPCFGTPPSPSENGRFGVYHTGWNRYRDST